jgi:hypothetical protein
VRTPVAARRAERLATEAVVIIDGTEHVRERANTYRALAEVLDVLGRTEEAGDAARRSLELYRQGPDRRRAPNPAPDADRPRQLGWVSPRW